MAAQPKKMTKKQPAKAKPQMRPKVKADTGPPKHLAYISEDEAKILGILETIRKGASGLKGKDGKPLPRTYSPGQGHPLEFLTELTSQQINEIMAKTDGKANKTKEGVPTLYMETTGGYQGGTTGIGTSSTSKSSGGISGGSSAGVGGVGSGSGSKSPGGASDTGGSTGGGSGGGTQNASREAQGNVSGTPDTGGSRDSGSRDVVGANAPTTRDTTSYGGGPDTINGPSTKDSGWSDLMQEAMRRSELATLQDQMSQYRSPPGSALANLADQYSKYRSPPGQGEARAPVYSGPVTYDQGAFNDNAKQRTFGGYPNSYDALASSSPNLVTPTGPGKTDRENVTTIEQNGISPFGPNVGFVVGSPPISKPTGLVSASGKTDREATIYDVPAVPEGPRTDRAPTVAATTAPVSRNVTEINRNPNGPMPQRDINVGSELGNLAVNSQFAAPLADLPGAYNQSELANAVTGEMPRTITGEAAYSGPFTQNLTDTSQRTPANLADYSQTVSGPGKTSMEPSAQDLVSGPGKIDRVRDIIMGNGPISPRTDRAPPAKTYNERVPQDESYPDQSTGTQPLDQNLIDLSRVPPAGGPTTEGVLDRYNTLTPADKLSQLQGYVDSAKPRTRALVADSSLSPLATEKAPVASQFLARPDYISPNVPIDVPQLGTEIAKTPGPRVTLPASNDLVPSVSPAERALQPSQMVAAPAPVSSLAGLADTNANQPVSGPLTREPLNLVDSTMPDISYDANQPSGTLFDAQAPAAPDTGGTTGGGGTTDTGTAPGPTPSPAPEPTPGPASGDTSEYAPGVMPWDRAAYQEIANAYQAAGQTYTPQQFIAAFYNEQPYSIEHPAANSNVPAQADGIMPWDMQAYEQLRQNYAAAGQTYTPQQFITQFYAQAA